MPLELCCCIFTDHYSSHLNIVFSPLKHLSSSHENTGNQASPCVADKMKLILLLLILLSLIMALEATAQIP